MNEQNINKQTRGIAFWREDLLKYEEQRAKHKPFRLPPLSQFVRDFFHEKMSMHTLSPRGKKRLALEVSNAITRRKIKRANPGGKKVKVLTEDAISKLPPPRFVKANGGVVKASSRGGKGAR